MKGKKLDAGGLWEYALRALAQRAHSTGELRLKLARHAAASEDVRATLIKLREYGLADDRRFAEAFSASRLQNNGFGKLRILRDLRLKNVPAQIAEDVLKKTFEDVDEQQLIEQFLHRKYRGRNLGELLKQPKQLAAAYRKLRLAGFSSGAAIGVLKRYAEAAEELSGLESEPEA